MNTPNPNEMMDEDLAFEDMMKDRFDEDMLNSEENNGFSDERLKEMNKKLPDWDLEPPFNFLK